MKKILYSLFFLLSLLSGSCSSDEEETLTELEQLVGIWRPIKGVDFGTDGIPTNITGYVGCEGDSRWVFKENGAFERKEFSAVTNNLDCEEDLESVNFESGLWEKADDNHISIVITFKNGETVTKRAEVGFLDNNIVRLFFEGATPEIEDSCMEFLRLE